MATRFRVEPLVLGPNYVVYVVRRYLGFCAGWSWRSETDAFATRDRAQRWIDGVNKTEREVGQ